jgi:ribonuclease HI
MSKALLRFDGGARPTNPGHAGFACVVIIDGEPHELSRYIGWKTNNYAEYMGLIVGIKRAKSLGATELEIVSDSKLVVNQINGEWTVKDKKLSDLHAYALRHLSSLFPDSWVLRWEKRDSNTDADDLCTQAIKYGMTMNLFTGKSKDGKVVDPFQSPQSARAVKFLAATARKAQRSS